jgi:hypothetical protein
VNAVKRLVCVTALAPGWRAVFAYLDPEEGDALRTSVEPVAALACYQDEEEARRHPSDSEAGAHFHPVYSEAEWFDLVPDGATNRSGLGFVGYLGPGEDIDTLEACLNTVEDQLRGALRARRERGA